MSGVSSSSGFNPNRVYTSGQFEKNTGNTPKSIDTSIEGQAKRDVNEAELTKLKSSLLCNERPLAEDDKIYRKRPRLELD